MIHKRTRQILKKAYSMEHAKKFKVKERLRQETVAIAKFMVNRSLFSKAYYEFNGIIALGQFINLGLALVGSLSAIYSVVSEIQAISITGTTENKNGSKVLQVDDDDIGIEIEWNLASAEKHLEEAQAQKHNTSEVKKKDGKKRRHEEKDIKTEQNVDDIASIFGDVPKKKKKKAKSKQKKSAMDEIFG